MPISLAPKQTLSIVLLIALTLSAYANSFAGVFQFDDFNVIVNNSAVHSFASLNEQLSQGIRPLLKLTYVINWVDATTTTWFHLTNLIIHVINALLVYLVSLSIIRRFASETEQSTHYAALLTALLFSLHPVQTEAVTYISGRSSSLMALCYFGAFYTYIKGRETGRLRWFIPVSLAFFLLGLGVKTPIVTLPAAIMLWEFVSYRMRPAALRNFILPQLPYWLLVLAMFALLLWHPHYGRMFDFSGHERSIAANLLSEINGVTYLVSRFVLLWRLNIDPDVPVFHSWHPVLAVELVLLLGILLTGVINLRKRPWLFFGVIWFFLQLTPTTTIIPRVDLVSERHLYLASFGVFLIVGVLFMKLLERFGSGNLAVYGAPALLLLLLGFATVERNDTYSSEIALWEDTASKSPNKARVFNNLGVAYYKERRWDEARAAFADAIERDPAFHEARMNLYLVEKRGRDEGGD